VTHTLFRLVSSKEASAVSMVLLWSGNTSDKPGPQGRPADPMQIVGEFHDDFVHTSEGWRIAHRKAQFVLHSKA
jgi:hypothetical protein